MRASSGHPPYSSARRSYTCSCSCVRCPCQTGVSAVRVLRVCVCVQRPPVCEGDEATDPACECVCVTVCALNHSFPSSFISLFIPLYPFHSSYSSLSLSFLLHLSTEGRLDKESPVSCATSVHVYASLLFATYLNPYSSYSSYSSLPHVGSTKQC